MMFEEILRCCMVLGLKTGMDGQQYGSMYSIIRYLGFLVLVYL